jgi:uncharacterized repeat protein (TIGR03806 family)
MADMRVLAAAVLLAGCGEAAAPRPADAAARAPDAAPDVAPDLPARPANPGCHPPAHPVPAGLEGLPLQLGETGCFQPADPTRPVAALVPYSVRTPLWSDGADKDRWLALPDGARIHVEADGDFTLPPGSVLIKTFRLGTQRIETRFFVHHENGPWSGYTYEWNDAGTDATLLDEGSHRKTIGQHEWHLPSRAECDNCHTSVAGHALGLELAQLDREQRQRLAALDLFDGPLPEVPALSDAGIEPARAYLHANCAGCHRPGVGNSGTTDLRVATLLSATGACNEAPRKGSLGLGADYKIIAPGQPDKSMMVLRMRELASGRMPPVGSLRVDEEGVALVSDWIRGLGGCE